MFEKTKNKKAGLSWRPNTPSAFSSVVAIIMNINDCFLKHNILIMAPQSKCSPLKTTIYHNYEPKL